MEPQRWAEIRTLFDELVELDPRDRLRRLEAVRVADPHLRDSVESLLAAHQAADERLMNLEAPFVTPTMTSVSSTRLSDPFGLTGRTISHFRVLSPLDSGGVGVVYRAEDTRLNRTVALKFLLPEFHLDAAAKQRFLHEGRSAARLDHPNLCTIYEVGESEEGQLFLAMALYPGETLKDRLAREGPLPIDQALGITRQLAQGLAYAHAEGIVHRDLKPGNLFLLPSGTLKILDFGLAKSRDLTLTGPGSTLGTVAYMAPEQIRAEPVDGRTDLWAVGVILHEMLTGRRPFPGEQDVATMHAILHEEPVPPSALRPDIPADVEDLVLFLLQKNIGGRPADAEEVLKRISTGAEPGRSAPTTASKRTTTRTRKRPGRALLSWGGVAALVMLAVLLWLGAGDGSWIERFRGASSEAALAENARMEPSLAILPFENLSEDPENEYFSAGIADEILTTLADLQGLRVISRTSVMHYRDSGMSIQRMGSELGVSHFLVGSVQRSGNRVRIQARLIDAARDVQIWAQRYDRPMEDIFAVQSEIARQIARALQAELSVSERGLIARRPTDDVTAYDLVLRGREYFRRYTERDNDAALQLFRRAIELDPDYVEALVALADAYRVKGQVFGPTEWEDSAVATARLAIALEPRSARAHNALGWALDWQSKVGPAREAYTRAIELNPDLTDGLANLSHHGYGRMDEAVRLYRHSLLLNPVDPVLLDLTGWAYRDLGMFERARGTFERVIEVQPVYWHAHARLAQLPLLEGSGGSLEAPVQRLFELFGENSRTLGFAGRLAAAEGDLERARAYFERAPAMGGAESERIVYAWVLQRMGEVERARTIMRTIARDEDWQSPDQKPEDLASRARIRVVEEDREEALRLLALAVERGWSAYYALPADPVLSSLRGEPRFDQLMAEVKTEVDRQRARVEREGW